MIRGVSAWHKSGKASTCSELYYYTSRIANKISQPSKPQMIPVHLHDELLEPLRKARNLIVLVAPKTAKLLTPPGQDESGPREEMLSRIMSRGMRQIGTADLILDRLMSVEMLYAAHDVLGAVLPTNC
jgi:hypothetical protein